MISENYKNALIEELAGEYDFPCDYVEDVIENEVLTGNWTEDKAKIALELSRKEEEKEEVNVTEGNVPEMNIEEIVDSLHVGFNFVPGVGAGYCSDELDLMKMKEFVRGALVAMEMMKGMLG